MSTGALIFMLVAWAFVLGLMGWLGISLNVAPDLSHYDGIVPCGIADQGVTSFEDLGQLVSMAEVDAVLRRMFEARFGPTAGGREGLVTAA